MMELPEAACMADQLNERITGKTITGVTANQTPHKLVWYFGDPEGYNELLCGQRVDKAVPLGGNVELFAGSRRILFQDGASPRWFAPGEERPKRHQLLIELDDFSALAVTVRMYGGLCAYQDGENTNPYYLVAKEKRSPFSETFDEAYFKELCHVDGFEKMSAKAFLATGQRIPGLGNGVLQDILWNARVHPKQKMGALEEDSLRILYESVKKTLFEMRLKGGRAAEKDLYGCPGGYVGTLGKHTAGAPCPACGSPICKTAYLGGSVYFCPVCQKEPEK